MSSCKDCVHFDVCMDFTKLKESEFAQNVDVAEISCDHFKNKADFVEVVRCEECKYASKCTDGYYACKVDHRLAHNEDDFCSYGERKEKDNG